MIANTGNNSYVGDMDLGQGDQQHRSMQTGVVEKIEVRGQFFVGTRIRQVGGLVARVRAEPGRCGIS